MPRNDPDETKPERPPFLSPAELERMPELLADPGERLNKTERAVATLLAAGFEPADFTAAFEMAPRHAAEVVESVRAQCRAHLRRGDHHAMLSAELGHRPLCRAIFPPVEAAPDA